MRVHGGCWQLPSSFLRIRQRDRASPSPVAPGTARTSQAEFLRLEVLAFSLVALLGLLFSPIAWVTKRGEAAIGVRLPNHLGASPKPSPATQASGEFWRLLGKILGWVVGVILFPVILLACPPLLAWWMTVGWPIRAVGFAATIVRRRHNGTRRSSRWGAVAAAITAALLALVSAAGSLMVLMLMTAPNVAGDGREPEGLNAATMLAAAVAGFTARKLRRWAASVLPLTVREARENDPRPPVLFLRPFHQDDFLMGGPLSRTHFEEPIVSVLRSFGPVIAIGRPGESSAPPGAARQYVTDDEWLCEVRRVAKEASIIVVSLGATEGLRTEIETLVQQNLLIRTIFVMPPVRPSSARRYVEDLFARVSAAGKTLRVSPEVLLPDVVAFILEADGTVFVANGTVTSSTNYDELLPPLVQHVFSRETPAAEPRHERSNEPESLGEARPGSSSP